MPITFGEIGFASRPDPQADAPGSAQLVLQPGEEGIILALEAEDENKPLYIISLACTQHPKTTYTYIVDGKSRALPAPQGTHINPLYTCRDWGAWLIVQSSFAIHIRNNDTVAHGYIAVIGYKQTK